VLISHELFLLSRYVHEKPEQPVAPAPRMRSSAPVPDDVESDSDSSGPILYKDDEEDDDDDDDG